jgi:hypothetical protein
MNKKGRKIQLHSSKLVMDNASSAVVCHVTELVKVQGIEKKIFARAYPKGETHQY